MRINSENKSMDIEPREVNYILDALLTQYLFQSRNEMPEVIIFPMYAMANTRYGEVPIQFISVTDNMAQDIITDGSNIAEVTEEQEAVIDEKDEKIKKLKAELAELETAERLGGTGKEPEVTTSEQLLDEAADLELEEDTAEAIAPPMKKAELVTDSELPSPARTAFAESPKLAGKDPEVKGIPDRLPKLPPGGDIGPGLGLSDMQARNAQDQKRMARDLKDEPDIKESEEKEFDKSVSRDDKGNPILEEN